MQEVNQQAVSKLRAGSNFLIILPPHPDGDVIGAALALRSLLKKLEKEVTVLCPNSGLDTKFSFLPEFEHIETELKITKNFVIDISSKRVEVEELSYKKEQDRLSIYLKPKAGQLESSDISFRSSNFPFDFVICVGVASLDQLGEYYSANAELFFETPVMNIDHSGANENYGQINLVKLNATSNAEIVFDLINEYESSLIDQNIATQLLTGIIARTNSFQHARTTPAALNKASQLIGLGGDQQEIIKQIFKTKSLGLLKLWGRSLARLKLFPDLNLALSQVNLSDIQKSGALEEDVENIIAQMATQLGVAKIFVFLAEKQTNSTQCFLAAAAPVDLLSLFAQYQPRSAAAGIKFVIPGGSAFAEGQILQVLQTNLPKL